MSKPTINIEVKKGDKFAIPNEDNILYNVEIIDVNESVSMQDDFGRPGICPLPAFQAFIRNEVFIRK